jgi:lipoyl(octanoyl) transferase
MAVSSFYLCNMILNREVVFQDLGSMPYKEAWDYQQDIFNAIVAQKGANHKLSEEEQAITANHLLFVEHPHVYTLGKSGSMENLLLNEKGLDEKGIEFYKINRGGDITYHGPGQIVGYPILNLDYFFTDIHLYMRSLEEVIIRTLSHYDIEAGRLEGYTGVWLDPENGEKARKICAMGVKCSRWVTMHGWAFNVNTDLDYFNYIIPCGIDDKAVTSMKKELGREMDFEEVKGVVRKEFENVFDCKLI